MDRIARQAILLHSTLPSLFETLRVGRGIVKHTCQEACFNRLGDAVLPSSACLAVGWG